MPGVTSHLPQPEFSASERPFQQELNRRVSAYFREKGLSPKATAAMKIKALFLYASFFGLYFSFFLFDQSFYSVALLAVGLVAVTFLIGMNVMHDCAHGTYFKNRTLTNLSFSTWDFFGVSGDMYRLKHLGAHHEFTNVTAWDGDMDLSYPILRLNPHLPLLPKHRYQKFYGPVLYSLLTLSWVFISDFLALRGLKVCNYKVKPFPRRTLIKLLAFKVVNLAVFIAIPSLFFPFLNVLLTFLFVQLSLGFLFSLIFQVAHINEKASFVISESGQIEGEWAVHQLMTTSNFATQSPFWRFALGGLNFQIEHHLFPSISHAHYPAIREIVKSTCKEMNLPYHEYPTFRSAAASHFRLLAKLGRQ